MCSNNICVYFSFVPQTGDASARDIDKAMKLGAGVHVYGFSIGLPIGYSVIVALTGLPIGYSVIVALTGLLIGYSTHINS